MAVALIALAILFWWRKRKQRKNAEELRRKEVEEYGFNPNNDPTLPAVGAAVDGDPEMMEDNSGYRGWGTTSTNRKTSTTLSGSRFGMALSDSENASTGYPMQPGSPTHPNGPHDGYPEGADDKIHAISDDSDNVGALGAVPVGGAGRDPNKENIHRGTSNASSAYSGNRSEGSGELGHPGAGMGVNNGQYYEEGPYDNYVQPGHGPYGDGTYSSGGGQPVIRDVQARRNTRIENPTHFPQQGNAGIAQNF